MPEDDNRPDLWRTEEGTDRDRDASPPTAGRLTWAPPEIPPAPRPRPTGGSAESLWGGEQPGQNENLQVDKQQSPNGARTRQRPRKRTRRGLRRSVKAIGILVVLALVADASYSIYGIAVHLPRTADNIQKARAALADGNVSGARPLLVSAAEDGEAAADLTRRPALTLLRVTPDGRYVASIAEAAELATRAGTIGLAATDELGGNAEDVAASLFSGGRMDLDAVVKAQGPVAEAAQLLTHASALLEGTDDPWIDAISDAGLSAEERISDAATSVATANEVLSVLPEMFGADEPRRYLLGFQALGEARATGGLIGFTGTLEASEGEIELVEVEKIQQSIPQVLDEPVDAPEWFAANYGPQSALTQPQQVNASPNFPAVAEVMQEMFESQTGREYDGMVLMDPVALEHLLPAVGPLEVEGWDDPITPHNVVDVTLRDSYLEFGPEEQNLFLTRIVQQFWDRIADGDFDAALLVKGLGKATSSQHFRLHAVDPAAAEAMATANVDGDYTRHDPNVQIAFHNNYSANKVDYYLRRDIVTIIKLERDGAIVNSSITMTNDAPTGPPSLLLGPSERYTPNDPPGVNRMLINVLLPRSAEEITFGSGDRRNDPVLYLDEGHPVPWQVAVIPPGEQVTVRLSYRITDPYERVDDGFGFRFTHYPQPAVTADTFSVNVTAPEGFGLLTSDERLGDDAPKRRHLLQGTLDAPATLDLRLIPNSR